MRDLQVLPEICSSVLPQQPAAALDSGRHRSAAIYIKGNHTFALLAEAPESGLSMFEPKFLKSTLINFSREALMLTNLNDHRKVPLEIAASVWSVDHPQMHGYGNHKRCAVRADRARDVHRVLFCSHAT